MRRAPVETKSSHGIASCKLGIIPRSADIEPHPLPVIPAERYTVAQSAAVERESRDRSLSALGKDGSRLALAQAIARASLGRDDRAESTTQFERN